MKTITLRVEDCDQVVIDELKDAYHTNNRFDKVARLRVTQSNSNCACILYAARGL
jgi:hypothetical protein